MSVDGLVSGIDTSSYIDAVMELARQPAAMLEAKQAKLQSQMVAFQTLNASLLALKQQAYAMALPTSLSQRTLTSSNIDLLTATASSSAARGTYTLRVNAVAQAHQIASQGFADFDSTTIGTGEFSITIGSGDDAVTTSVTVDSDNNTLAGLRSAINESAADVTAFIINTGGDSAPYQLVMCSNQTGADNALWISDTLAGGTAPDFFTAASVIGSPDTAGFTTTTTSPTMGGTYTGSIDKAYTFTFNMDGTVGSTAGLKLLWDDGEGNTGELDVGDTYTADTALDVAEGVTAALSAGDATNGDYFTVDTTAADLRMVQAAQDASVSVGSSAGGGTPITVTSSSNTVANVVPGVTLNVLAADAESDVRLTIDYDKSGVADKIAAFVSAYNTVADKIAAYTAYDPATDTSGVLLGNSAALRVESELTRIVSSLVPGQPDGFGALASIGVTYSATGHLVVDSSELDEALESNFDAVANLFRLSGASDNSKVAFIAAGDDTVPTTDGYEVEITQAATQGVFAAGSITDPATSALVVDSTNNEIRISIDDTLSEVLSLSTGTYTSGASLAAEMQARINGSEELGAAEATVTWVDDGGGMGHLEIQSRKYGSVSSAGIGASPTNSAHTVLGLDSGAATDGQDVAGTINGESATGQGQLLTGDAENDHTAGLRLLVTLTAGDLGAGAEATVTVTRGLAVTLEDRLGLLTDSVDGLLTQRSESLQDEVDRLAEEVEAYDKRLELRRERMVQQFAAMEAAMAGLQTQGEYVSQALSSLSWGGSTKDK